MVAGGGGGGSSLGDTVTPGINSGDGSITITPVPCGEEPPPDDDDPDVDPDVVSGRPPFTG